MSNIWKEADEELRLEKIRAAGWKAKCEELEAENKNLLEVVEFYITNGHSALLVNRDELSGDNPNKLSDLTICKEDT